MPAPLHSPTQPDRTTPARQCPRRCTHPHNRIAPHPPDNARAAALTHTTGSHHTRPRNQAGPPDQTGTTPTHPTPRAALTHAAGSHRTHPRSRVAPRPPTQPGPRHTPPPDGPRALIHPTEPAPNSPTQPDPAPLTRPTTPAPLVSPTQPSPHHTRPHSRVDTALVHPTARARSPTPPNPHPITNPTRPRATHPPNNARAARLAHATGPALHPPTQPGSAPTADTDVGAARQALVRRRPQCDIAPERRYRSGRSSGPKTSDASHRRLSQRTRPAARSST